MVLRVDNKKSTAKVEKKKNGTEAETQGYKVKSGDTIQKLMKAFNFKNEQEFRKYFGLSGTAKLKAGQILKTPTAHLETTFAAISRKYNMSMADLKALNPQIENFDVLKKNTPINVPIRPFVKDDPKKDTPAPKPQAKPKARQTAPKPQPAPAVAKEAPEDIAKALKKSANKWGAVDKDAFKEPFSKINKNNVIDVIKSYDEISKGESLVEMICDEVTNSKKDRKAAVTKLFNTLCEKVGPTVATEEIKEQFFDELNDEFDSLFWISTGKMDKIINQMISAYKEPKNYTKDAPGQTSGVDEHGFPVSNNTTEVHLRNGKSRTVAELRNGANDTAQKTGATVSRPEPVLDENGKIVADVREFEPTLEGSLSGKTIIVNAGHGGYNPKNGIFDIGTYADDANGKLIEEWYKNKNFVDEIIPALQAQGAKVIYMNGSAANIMKAKREYRDADLFISIHCDASANKSANGQTILYKGSSTDAKRLASVVENNLEQHDWIAADSCRTKADDRGLGVLNAVPEMPSVLIETGFQSNPKDLANIDSQTYREGFARHLTDAVVEYFNPDSTGVVEITEEQSEAIADVESLGDVAELLDVSEDFIRKLKRVEDHGELDEDEFHNTRYRDNAGNLTIGIGHLWREGEPTELSDEEVCQQLAEDLSKAEKELKKLLGAGNYAKLPQSLKEALLDMTFNKGAGIIKNTPGMVWALKNDRYDGAVCKMTNNRSTATKEEMSGLSKRRLFDMSLASEMYDGNPPDVVVRTAQKVYDRGIELLKKECKEKGWNFENQLAGYNRDVQSYWGDKIKLKTQ